MLFVNAFAPRALLASLALVLTACGGASSDEPKNNNATDAAENKTENATGAFAEMSVGSDDAKVTVIEYASTTCPHCADFHNRVYSQIKKDYVDTGKVKFIFREFPTPPANLAAATFMLARCAADQKGSEGYFLVLDTLFKTQGVQKERSGWLFSEDTRADLLRIANQVNLNEADFDTCINRPDLLEHINNTVEHARNKYEIQSTPTFVINGNVRNPRHTVEAFSEILDEALEKAETAQ